jgi:HlyD family secretion protein
MKKVILSLVVLIILGLSGWLGYYFYKKSKTDPVVYKTEKPFTTTIVKKTVATGSIVPRREVQVKSQVSGIVEELYVEAGQIVKVGQLIAKVKIVPNIVQVNQAETDLATARINLENAKRELDRQKGLFDGKVIAEQEYNRFLYDFKLRKEAVQAAESNLLLVREGASKRTGQVSNLVYSPIAGMLLDVPVKIGTSIIERNTFNSGSTIATVADMRDLIFEGNVDESEVGKIREGMDLNLNIGALEGKTYKAALEYISPKGDTVEGAIKFRVRAKMVLDDKDFLRAGYSANADIVLDRKDSVLAIKESMLQFKKDSTFVEIEKSPQQFEKRLVKTGISDGINIEILSGVNRSDKIKTTETPEKDKEEPKGS